jgi:hypothetical protein
MPIDASIPLQAKPPQPIDLAASYQKANTLLAQKQALQEGGLRLQENALKLQDQKTQSEDDEKIRNAYLEAKGDLKKTLELVRIRNVGPVAVKKLEDMIFQKKQDAFKDDESTRKAKLARYDELRSIFKGIDDIKEDEPAAEMFKKAYWVAKQRGLIDEETDAAINKLMPEGFNRQGFNFFKYGLVSAAQSVAEEASTMRAQSQMIRAQAFERDLQAKLGALNYKNKTDRMRAEAYIKDKESEIQRRTDLSEIERLELENTVKWHRSQIKQAEKEEEGRRLRWQEKLKQETEKLEKTEKGKTERAKLIEGSKTERAREGNLSTDRRMELRAKLALWEDLDGDEQDQVREELFDLLKEDEGSTPANPTPANPPGNKPSSNGKKPAANRFQYDKDFVANMKVGSWYVTQGERGTMIWITKMPDGKIVEQDTPPPKPPAQ